MKFSKLVCCCIAFLSVQFQTAAHAQEKQAENGEKKEQAAIPDPTNAHRLEMANKVLDGQKLDAKTFNDCLGKFKEFRARMKAKYPVKPPVFTEEDDAIFYCQAYLMAIIDPDDHGGWPFRFKGLNNVYAPLKKELEKKDDTLIMAAIIIPAVKNNDIDYATKVFKKLHEKDPKLSKHANEYIKDFLISDPKFQEFSKNADEIAK